MCVVRTYTHTQKKSIKRIDHPVPVVTPLDRAAPVKTPAKKWVSTWCQQKVVNRFQVTSRNPKRLDMCSSNSGPPLGWFHFRVHILFETLALWTKWRRLGQCPCSLYFFPIERAVKIIPWVMLSCDQRRESCSNDMDVSKSARICPIRCSSQARRNQLFFPFNLVVFEYISNLLKSKRYCIIYSAGSAGLWEIEILGSPRQLLQSQPDRSI